MQLLQKTASACTVEYLLQSLTNSPIVADLAQQTSTLARKSLATVVGCDNVADDKWMHASIPARLGGLGIRDPLVIAPCARLASLVNVAELGITLGASQTYISDETEKAIRTYMERLGTVERPELRPSKDLQKELTQPFYQRMMDRLMREGDPITQLRLNSLSTRHALAWVTAAAVVKTLSPKEACAALRWVLGIPFRDCPYICPDCGSPADSIGVHAVTCHVDTPFCATL